MFGTTAHKVNSGEVLNASCLQNGGFVVRHRASVTDLTESFRPGRPPEMQPVPHWERLEEVCCGAGAGGERSVGLRGLVLRSQGTWGHLFSGGRVPGLAPGVRGRWGLRGISPALAGKLGVG